MKNTQLTVKERKKSLEANTSTVTGKSNKVVHSSNFSIKPLIKFFNKTFKKENIVDSGNISSRVGQSEITETNPNTEEKCEETSMEEIWEGTAEQGGAVEEGGGELGQLGGPALQWRGQPQIGHGHNCLRISCSGHFWHTPLQRLRQGPRLEIFPILLSEREYGLNSHRILTTC